MTESEICQQVVDQANIYAEEGIAYPELEAVVPAAIFDRIGLIDGMRGFLLQGPNGKPSGFIRAVRYDGIHNQREVSVRRTVESIRAG